MGRYTCSTVTRPEDNKEDRFFVRHNSTPTGSDLRSDDPKIVVHYFVMGFARAQMQTKSDTRAVSQCFLGMNGDLLPTGQFIVRGTDVPVLGSIETVEHVRSSMEASLALERPLQESGAEPFSLSIRPTGTDKHVMLLSGAIGSPSWRLGCRFPPVTTKHMEDVLRIGTGKAIATLVFGMGAKCLTTLNPPLYSFFLDWAENGSDKHNRHLEFAVNEPMTQEWARIIRRYLDSVAAAERRPSDL